MAHRRSSFWPAALVMLTAVPTNLLAERYGRDMDRAGLREPPVRRNPRLDAALQI